MTINLSNPIFHDEDKARAFFEAERWPNGVVCPFCDSAEHVKPLQGPSMGPGWYHCGDCRQKFTVRVGTVMERSHIPLHKWALAFRLMASSKKGMSAHQVGRSLGITYKTAWFMCHRIREAMRDTSPKGSRLANSSDGGRSEPAASPCKLVLPRIRNTEKSSCPAISPS